MGSVLHSRAPWCGGGVDGSCLPRARATSPCRRNPKPGLDFRNTERLPEPLGNSKPIILRGRPNALRFITLGLPVRIGHTIAILVDPGTTTTDPGSDHGNPDGTAPQSVSQPHAQSTHPLESNPVADGDPASTTAE